MLEDSLLGYDQMLDIVRVGKFGRGAGVVVSEYGASLSRREA